MKQLTEEDQQEMLSILIECDEDFIPSLSSRREKGQSQVDKLKIYMEEKKNYPHLFVYKDKQLIGFSNFIHKEIIKINYKDVYTNFIDTTCILPDYRNLGIGKNVYAYYENLLPEQYKLSYIARETWSTNYRQIHIYEQLGYKRVAIKLNDRGEDIHTYTYIKKVK